MKAWQQVFGPRSNDAMLISNNKAANKFMIDNSRQVCGNTGSMIDLVHSSRSCSRVSCYVLRHSIHDAR